MSFVKSQEFLTFILRYLNQPGFLVIFRLKIRRLSHVFDECFLKYILYVIFILKNQKTYLVKHITIFIYRLFQVCISDLSNHISLLHFLDILYKSGVAIRKLFLAPSHDKCLKAGKGDKNIFIHLHCHSLNRLSISISINSPRHISCLRRVPSMTKPSLSSNI